MVHSMPPQISMPSSLFISLFSLKNSPLSEGIASCGPADIADGNQWLRVIIFPVASWCRGVAGNGEPVLLKITGRKRIKCYAIYSIPPQNDEQVVENSATAELR